MPYTHCPSCRLTTFSAAAHSSRDECPRCGTELMRQPRRLFLRPDLDPVPGPAPAETSPEAA